VSGILLEIAPRWVR